MKKPATRRQFLTVAGVVGVTGLAGCSGDADPASSTTEPTDVTSTPMPQTTSGSGGAETSASQSQAVDSPFERGSVVDDFESIGTDDSRWGTIGGTVEADTEDVYAGTQSVRLRNENGDVAGIYRSFPDGLDLTSHDLSIAVKLEQPVRGRIAAEFIAPARSDMLTSKRFVPKELNDWVRVDLGYTGRKGDPMMEAIQELRLMVLTEEGTPIDFHLDDLRTIPKPETGKVVLQFDDSRASHYDVAFQELQERGWAAGSAIIPDAVNSDGYLTTGQMREMRDAGWDMMSHPQAPKPLPQYSEAKQRELIQRAYNYLDLKGFSAGARHFVAPYNRVSTTTLDIVSEFHDAGYLFGACPNNAQQPSNTYTMSRVMGRDPQGTRRILNIADTYNQLVVVTWHTIGDSPDDETSLADFRNVLDHIEQTGLEVVTPSEFLDG